MRRKHLTYFLLIALLSVAAFAFYLYEEPQTAPARAIFRLCYRFAGGGDRLLTFYSFQLGNTNAGYIPTEVDTFLCSRIRSPASVSEFDALVHFYILQSGDRTGEQLGLVPDDIKERVIDAIIRKLTTLDYPDRLSAVVLIEYLRLDGKIHKPDLSGDAGMDEDGKVVLVPEVIDEAAARFTEWWHSPIPWPQKKQISPLEGSKLSIMGIP